MSTLPSPTSPAEVEARAAATGSHCCGWGTTTQAHARGPPAFRLQVRCATSWPPSRSAWIGLTSRPRAAGPNGLRAEREQAHHDRRRLPPLRHPAAPHPGRLLARVVHTRNTVTLRPTSLVDARNAADAPPPGGVAALPVVLHVIVAVNKTTWWTSLPTSPMAIEGADIRVSRAWSRSILPTSALLGDDHDASASTLLLRGADPVLGLLESPPPPREEGAFRLPVQLVIRPGGAPAPELRLLRLRRADRLANGARRRPRGGAAPGQHCA